jgi:DNA polymerase III sliding clamp (beta) subunit (PCNA family)
MSALAGATRIIERRASVPILAHVALEADGCLMLRATDLETAYETRIPCQTQAAGVATVDARTLLAVLSAINHHPRAGAERRNCDARSIRSAESIRRRGRRQRSDGSARTDRKKPLQLCENFEGG